MDIKFVNPVAFVKDVDVSKRFYTEVMRLNIAEDFNTFILFENHFSIIQAQEFTATVFGKAVDGADQHQGRNNLLLYFETTDLEGTFAQLKDQVKLIHPIQRQPWGQRVFRFYDPDNHIVEIGEPFTPGDSPA